MAPASADVLPVRVVSTSGSVTGAQALTDGGGGDATLSMSAGRPPPAIVLDYGKDVGGVPYFVVRSESGSPGLSASYSEGRQYDGAMGDQTPSASPAGDPVRVDDLTVTSSGRLSTGLIQGAERYERLTLTSPGSVTLSSIGVTFSAVRATAKDFRGWFDSNSSEFDRIWFDGAYTTQLNELPAGAVSAPWSISAGALQAVGRTAGLLRRGLDWTDYTVSFETRVVEGAADWMVRASSVSAGYFFTLGQGSGGPGADDTLQAFAIGPGEYTPVADTALPAASIASGWYRVTTVATGSHVTVSVDGRRAVTLDLRSLPSGAPVYASGTVGFATQDSTAVFRDLKVTGTGGAVLYDNALSRPSALNGFSGANAVDPDPLPVITDGARRDKVVWSGDLGVEVPNALYTTEADSYVRGSLQLLASYQVTDGESGTNVNPTSPLATSLQPGSTYSASYSMDEVDNIATYYLYTGDLSFVRSEWPMITRELAYNRSMVDGRGLLVTDAADGMDWDYYDGSKIGEVTAYNDIYYETLLSAATMAEALGLPVDAYVYRDEAAALRSAINRYLFNPSTHLYAVSNLLGSAVAQDGNSLAVVFGVAPEDEDKAIMAALVKELPSTPYGPESFTANAGYRAAVSPFVTNEEVEALFIAGDTSQAIALVRRLWGYMDAPGPDYTGADWELVGADGSPGFGYSTSLAHGWSSGATTDLSSYVLGVGPSTPGFRTWSVKPHPGPLAWVEGDVPTPRGTIAVRWAQQRSSGRLTLQVSAPARTSGTISVPVPRPGAVVTLRAARASRPAAVLRTVTATAGTAYLPLAVPGGKTYEVSVVPR